MTERNFLRSIDATISSAFSAVGMASAAVYTTRDGDEVTRTTCQGSLYAPDGAPRFPVELYAQIRDSLYALAVADGCVVPA